MSMSSRFRITYLIELRITLFLRSPIHFLLANVAVADITFSIFHISELSLRNISNKPEGMSGPGFCFLRISPIQWIGATCSTLSLVLIAFERYFVVRNPHGNQKLSTEKLKARIFLSTLFQEGENLTAMLLVNQFMHGVISKSILRFKKFYQ